MGIKFLCPNGHKLNVKTFLAGKKGVCPECRERFVIPLESTPKQCVVSIGVASSAMTSAGAHADEEVVEDAADEAAEVAGAYGGPAPQVAVAAHPVTLHAPFLVDCLPPSKIGSLLARFYQQFRCEECPRMLNQFVVNRFLQFRRQLLDRRTR